MIAEIFNSSLISGPETLVLPNLKHLKRRACVIWLKEERCAPEANRRVQDYFERHAETHIIPVHSRNDRDAARELRVLLHSLGASIAHAHDVKASFLLARAGASENYRRISTHHGVHARSGALVRLYEEIYCRFVLPHFDRSLVVCTSDRESLVRRGVPAERVRVHLNGIDRNVISWSERAHARAELHRAWGLKAAPGEKIFGIVARLAREKDHEFALRLLAQVRDLPFRVLCFGTGPLAEKLARKTNQLGLSNKVLWMGYRKTLSQELHGFDGILSLSRAEGLPINLIEAGFANTPIFARVVDGVADLLPSPIYGDPVLPDRPESEWVANLKDFILRDETVQAKKALAMQERVISGFSGLMWAKRLDEIADEL
jgi:glycosyltransferase involved in cell wall biosynthesis